MFIKVSFKQNEEWLYDFSKSHSSASAWIKDLIKKEYKKEHQENHQSNYNTKEKGIFDMIK